MLPEDEKRLQREADIAKSIRPPDYSRLENEIANAKAEQAGKDKAGQEADAQWARGAAIRRAREQVWAPVQTTSEKDDGWER